jgi:primase-polymerase (primpol)-like protein
MTVYTHNRILPVKVENIPEELMARPQWVVWHAVGAKPDNVPYSVRTGRKASSTDLMTWSSFKEAVEAYEHGEYAGLGFVFCSGDPYTGVDLDGCVEGGGTGTEARSCEILGYGGAWTSPLPRETPCPRCLCDPALR